MKFRWQWINAHGCRAAPFTGAWIEMVQARQRAFHHQAAPFTGAWIEIQKARIKSAREYAAPFTGAWIEIF